MISINDDIIKRLEARSYDIYKEPLTHLTPISIPDQKSSVSLDKAVEPLTCLLPNLETFVCIAKEKCENPGDGLTQDESASIMLYTMDWQPSSIHHVALIYHQIKMTSINTYVLWLIVLVINDCDATSGNCLTSQFFAGTM
jgi:hypothetical protein